MVYAGQCHCGKISFEVEGTIENVIECNCSICIKRGYLLWFVPRENLRLKTPEASLSTYLFNKKAIQHRFCKECGCGPFGEGINPKTGKAMAAVNIRCLEEVDLKNFKTLPFDGRSM